jgi:tetratricopeptide (TPR) repeat protein
MKGLEWPPTCTLVKEDDINAFAYVESVGKTGPGDKAAADARPKPRVVVFRGMIDKVIRTKDDKDADAAADRLAYVLGHELSHILLGHVLGPADGATPLSRRAFGREQEIAADVRGAELALKAGFSLRRGLESIRRMQKSGMEYSSFEGLHVGHPSWNDRLVHLDKEQAGLWKAMSAFENGAFFLMAEQFPSAEVCFRHVVREFPKCHEAWANLGYALLMQYCDGLDTDDVRRFQIGQLLIAGFYRRPASLEPETRGIQTKVWDDAVACLQKSLQLKPDQAIAKANLGIAYLVHPDGKPDVAKASRYLQEAATQTEREDDLDPLTRAAILINAGVADLAARRRDAGEKKFDQGEKVGSRRFGGDARLFAHTAVASALRYNRAIALSAADKPADALRQFEEYLELSSAAGAWWPLAYEHYAALCKKAGREPRTKADLSGPAVTRRRMVTSVRLGSGATLAVSEPVADAAERLGEKVPVVSRTKLSRWHCPQHGVDVLATDRILAIHLVGDKAPPLQVRETGLGGKVTELRLNMPEAELNRVLADEVFDSRPLDDPKVPYQFYPRLGIAVRVKDGKVSELAVAQIPRARPGE